MREYLRRGAVAGVVAGAAYGVFVAGFAAALVAPFEGGHHAGDAAGAANGGAASVVAGGVWGLLLGVAVFGLGYYLLEPAIPGGRGSRSYVLAGAGFVATSGAPWLVLPPQPPGTGPTLSATDGLALYAGMMVVGAAACAVAVAAFRRFEGNRAVVGAALPFLALVGAALVAPDVATTRQVDAAALSTYRASVVLGQIVLWGLLATVHGWLTLRTDGVPERYAASEA